MGGIISFSLTENEFVSRRKYVTRRFWQDSYAARCTYGSIYHAWSALPFVDGARKLGKVRILCDAYRQPLHEMTTNDLLAEGGMCQTVDEFCELIGESPDAAPYVVWFEIIELVESDQ